MRKLFIVLPFVFLLTGCGFNNAAQDGDMDQDDYGTKLMTDGYNPENLHKNVDYSEQNPNVDISNSPLNTNENQEQIENVLNMEKGYWLGSMWTNGNDAWVTVFTSNDLTKTELNKKEKQLRDKFQDALPRFDIRVQLKEKE
ncbi:hypothetical protein [Bacillus sp. FJAT-47783]|uniref:hypothetical protein n=1 Tax=Bacillus sp. FJAT-47783 TaxID=2922712 RepID=UPI001FAD9F26|nr:hypothetical protein [Bacillus sp. FJAT-47783]